MKDGVFEDVDVIVVDDDCIFVDFIFVEKVMLKCSCYGWCKLFDDLFCEIEVIFVDDIEWDCFGCGCEWCVIGYEMSEVFEFVLVYFKVIEYCCE